jgi:hypothetical protein
LLVFEVRFNLGELVDEVRIGNIQSAKSSERFGCFIMPPAFDEVTRCFGEEYETGA